MKRVSWNELEHEKEIIFNKLMSKLGLDTTQPTVAKDKLKSYGYELITLKEFSTGNIYVQIINTKTNKVILSEIIIITKAV